MIFLDTNIIIDVLEPQESAAAIWSRNTFARVAQQERFMTNVIVLAELTSGLADADAIERSLMDAEIKVIELDRAASLRAGGAFGDYRRRGEGKQSILADFLIAGHAATLGATLMTRDKRLASYFPDLTLLTPETDHG
jgi:predicted nucleic acid-binding protein